MDNKLRRELLNQTKQAQAQGFQGSVLDVFSNPGVLQEFGASVQQQMQQQMPQQGAPMQATPQQPQQPQQIPQPGQNRNVKLPAQPQAGQQHLVKPNPNVGIVSLGSGPKKGEMI